jgi:lipid-binding SYLF domain-containing protein
VVKAGIDLAANMARGCSSSAAAPGGYYNLISGSFGFQLGVQTAPSSSCSATERALAPSFEGTYGWKVGVDGSVAIVTLGAGGAIDTENLTSPVLGFIPRSGRPHVQP